MFEVGSFVVYGMTGVCRITEIRTENFTGQPRTYYILTPVDNPGMVIYVPTDESSLTEQMKELLSAEEWIRLIRSLPEQETVEWIADPRGRGELFKQILQGGDRRRLFQMLKTIRCRREEQAANGKKLYVADESAFQKAEKLLYTEIATVMKLRPDEVQAFIRDQLPAEG